MKNQAFIVPLLGIILSFCTPPPGWKNSPYLYGRYAGSTIRYSGDSIRVLIYSGPGTEITSEGVYQYKTTSGTKSGRGRFSPVFPGEIKFSEKGFALQSRQYNGDLFIHDAGGGKLNYVIHVLFEDYLVSVLGHEMGDSWPLEALKAQAVVARTYAIARINNKKDYDMTSDTTNQVFGGNPSKSENLKKAVAQTAGLILAYDGKPADVYFHSSCGGSLASSSEVWKTNRPYLVQKKTGDCVSSSAYKWKYETKISDFAKIIGLSSVSGVNISSKTPSGRVDELIFTGGGTFKKISAADFRKKIGGVTIKSTLFGIRISGNNIQISGKGYGHGVGMCQWGARAKAASQSFRAIIEYYFPGVRITDLRSVT